jgi:two-component system response regulator TtrR
MSNKEMDPQHQATIFIVDDNAELIEALALNLKSEGYLVETFTDAQVFLKAYSSETLGCLLLDVRMPGMSGDELQKALIERKINIPIIFMSGYSDVPVAVGTLKNGAVDFLTKPVNQYTLLKAIHKALKIDIEQRERSVKNSAAQEHYDSLTKSELEIMELIVLGKLNKIIADELNISVNTVENHRANIMHKMKVKTVAELVCVALTNGFVHIGTTAKD